MMTTSDGKTVVLEHLRLILEQFCSPVSDQSWGKLMRSCRLSHRGSGVDCSHFLQVVADTSLKENGSKDKEEEADAEEGRGKHRLARTVEDYEALLFQKVAYAYRDIDSNCSIFYIVMRASVVLMEGG